MKLFIIIIAICLTQLSACSSTSAQQENEVVSVNKESKVCTTEQKRTGSSIRRKKCKTPENNKAD